MAYFALSDGHQHPGVRTQLEELVEGWAWREGGGQICLVLRDQGMGLNEYISTGSVVRYKESRAIAK